ncbi:MAG: hypothetical protein AAGN66_00855 [Acidobacteriota bacterium]
MPARSLGFFDYLKAAFHWRARVPLLGAMPVNYLGLAAFGVLGLANPGFWFVGAAAELAYLMGLAGSERFQKLVQGERLMSAQQSWDDRVRNTLARLDAASQTRYRQLLARCQHVLGIGAALEDDEVLSLQNLRSGGLNQLLWIYLRLLSSRNVLVESLGRVDSRGLERKLADLDERIEQAEAESALERSLRGTRDIQQKRLENMTRAEGSLQVIDAELERIEHHVVLIGEEAAVGGKAEILSSRLDSVTSALSETNRWMDQNAEIFGSLGADPLGEVPADLPRLDTVPPIPEQ